MRLLALDVGDRRTGCAFCDETNGIPLPLETLTHSSLDELVEAVMMIIRDRKIDLVIVGHPLLPSGASGTQAKVSEACAQRLRERNIRVALLDERYTTPQRPLGDGDAQAACALLLIWLEKPNLTNN